MTGNVQLKTTFTPEEQLELRKRFEQANAKTRAEKKKIFETYRAELGMVNNATIGNGTAVPKNGSINLGRAMGLERNDNQPKAVATSGKNSSFVLNDLYERLQIANENDVALQQECNELLTTAGLVINDGEISYDGDNVGAKIQTVLEQFVNNHKDQYLVDSENRITFDMQKTDQEFIDNLTQGDSPAIVKDGDSYVIKDKNAVENALPNINGVDYHSAGDENAKKTTIQVTTRSVSSKATNAEDLKPSKVDGAEIKLRENKEERDRITDAAKQGYEKFITDPEKMDAVTLYVATNKYDKQVQEHIKELSLTVSHAYGKDANEKVYSISKNYSISGGQVVDLFLNRLPEEQQDELLEQIMQFANSKDKVIQEKMVEVLKGTFGKVDLNGPNGDSYKTEAAKLIFLEGMGLKPSELLRMIAVNDVMSDRTPEQIAADNKYFVESQSKDYAKHVQAEQDYNDTTVHLTKESRKAGESGLHTDVGNRGRQLVKQAPQVFCDVVTEDEYKNAKNTPEAGEYLEASIYEHVKDENGNLTGKKQLKTVFYKFNSQKYKEFMKIACDPTSAFDPTNAKKLEDLNMTLKEGRDGLELTVINSDGDEVPIVNLLGNNNGKTDNSELNAWRHMAEKAGLTVDYNPTYVKRLGDFAKKLGINGLLTLGTLGLGSMAGQLLNLANSTLPKVLKAPDQYIQTPDRYFTTPDQTITPPEITFTTPVETIKVDGEAFEHHMEIDGVDYPMYFQGEDRYINVGGKTYKFQGDSFTLKGKTYKLEGERLKVDGGEVEVKSENPGTNMGKLIAISEVATAVGTSIGWLMNDRDKIHAKGRGTDDLYDPTIYENVEDTETKSVSCKLPQYRRVEARSGQVKTELETKMAVKNRYLNAYFSLYDIPEGTTEKEFVEAYKEALGLTGKNMPRNENNRDIFVAVPSLTINGQKCALKANWNELYNEIPQGTPGAGTGQKVAVPKGQVKAEGRLS